MLKKLFCLSLMLATAFNCCAETCPTIAEIKNGYFRGWQPLNINSGDPISTPALETFKKAVHHFTLAEWMADAPEGPAHCYYQGQRPTDADYLGVFLAKENLVIVAGHDWQPVGADVMQCRAGLYNCLFQVKTSWQT